MSRKTHQLKTAAPYWDAIKSGDKTFEVRRNDRCFQKGDIIQLYRLHPNSIEIDSSAEILSFKIGWMLQGGQFGIEPGFCVFTLVELK